MIREIDYVNGTDCGAGYDVLAYLVDEYEGAAQITHLPTKRTLYVFAFDDEYVRHLANGAYIPLESEDGAEAEWDRLRDEYSNQTKAA